MLDALPNAVMKAGTPAAEPNTPTWVSGQIASLGAGASVTIVFDLGANWALCDGLCLQLVTSAALASASLSCSDDGVATAGPLASESGSAVVISVAAGSWAYLVRPSGRYVLLQANNGPAAQSGAALARLTAYMR